MLKTPELSMPRTNKVTTVCNGNREVWTDYEEAKAYFLELMMTTEGEEHERAECVKTIARASDELFAVDGFAPNAVPAQEIEDIAGFYTNAHTSGSLDEAIRSAKAAAAGSGGIVVVCGSLYLASEYLNMAGSSSNCAD